MDQQGHVPVLHLFKVGSAQRVRAAPYSIPGGANAVPALGRALRPRMAGDLRHGAGDRDGVSAVDSAHVHGVLASRSVYRPWDLLVVLGIPFVSHLHHDGQCVCRRVNGIAHGLEDELHSQGT